ncbi:hypothetical protein GCM10011509_35210 [Ornithinimicrobium pekingense]|uniref:Uncharacterized protein n=1 Tax=Ornithinimicrobium pekingense TaxID=384677 RepID=A0ABQ2FCI8_9MICO|nr:hypothetical protein GCM10011509_35210 [Ornithinimicrobium pekingense]
MIAPRVFDAVPNRQPHDEVEDDDGDDPHEKKERFYPCDIHAPDHSRRWGSTSGNAAWSVGTHASARRVVGWLLYRRRRPASKRQHRANSPSRPPPSVLGVPSYRAFQNHTA